MKKVGGLIALATVVTIGGVYATWTYSNGELDIADVTKEMVIEMDAATITGVSGTYSVTSNVSFSIDQAGTNTDGNNFHKAMLNITTSDNEAPYITITFTPSENADSTIKETAVDSEYYFTTTTTMQYAMATNGDYDANGTKKDIFKFPTSENGPVDIDWVRQDNGTFTYTFDEAAIKAAVQINDFVLDTKAEHDAFKSVLNGNIIIYVSDGTPAASN